MHCTWFSSTILKFWKCPQIKEGGLNFLGGNNSGVQNGWIIWSPLLYFIFTSLKEPSYFFIHSISMHCTWFSRNFHRFSKFPQIKEGGTDFLGGNQFYRTAELFGPLFCISSSKLWRTQNLYLSSDFNLSCVVEQCFSRFFKIWKDSRR